MVAYNSYGLQMVSILSLFKPLISLIPHVFFSNTEANALRNCCGSSAYSEGQSTIHFFISQNSN